MRDWKLIAKASGLELPDAEMDRLVTTLEKLDETFRSAVQGLHSVLEPATTFSAEDDGE